MERKDEHPNLPTVLPTLSKPTGPPHLPRPPPAIPTAQRHKARIWGSLHVPAYGIES